VKALLDTTLQQPNNSMQRTAQSAALMLRDERHEMEWISGEFGTICGSSPLAVAALTLGVITQAPAQSSEQALGNFSSGVLEMDDSHTLITTREIDASVVKVWAAWHDPNKIAKWWGPEGFRSTVKELDIRAGGRFEVIMHGPDGTDYENLYIFDHVEEHKQLIYTSAGSKQFGLAPYQSVFDLEPIGSKTRVVLKARFVSADDKRKHVEEFHAIEGSRQLLQRLEEQAK
jgi:uncharacterized protein YndB with AHSA1/START domain